MQFHGFQEPFLPSQLRLACLEDKEASQEKNGHSWGRTASPEASGGISSLL